MQSSPYVNARRTWNDRFGPYIANGTIGMIIGALGVLTSLVCIWMLYQVSSTNKVEPYLVAVDKLGHTTVIGRPDSNNAIVLERVDIAELKQFVEQWREVSLDATIQQQKVFEVYTHLIKGTPAATKMNDFFTSNHPFERGKEITVSVDVSSVLPVKENVYEVEWKEVEMDRKAGTTLADNMFKAVFYVSHHKPKSEKDIAENPAGLIVDDFNWSKEL